MTDIIQAVKDSKCDYTTSLAKRTPCTDDAEFCERNGVCTFEVARTIGETNARARRMLDKEVKEGTLRS